MGILPKTKNFAIFNIPHNNNLCKTESELLRAKFLYDDTLVLKSGVVEFQLKVITNLITD